MASWPQLSAKATAAGQPRDIDLDPKYEWHDSANSYLLRFDLPGFKKEELRLIVDPCGRLTILGQRPAGYVRVNRAFQLPPTADLDRIAARFDGSALHLTVPKMPVGAAETVRARTVEEEAEAEAVTVAVAWWECETKMEKERSKWEVIAAAVTAFALGAIVTHKLFLARNS